MRDFNLLVSTLRRRENEACTEIWYLLEMLGDPDSQTDYSRIPGLVLAKTSLNPFQVIEGLRRIFNESPEMFHYVLKVTPIEQVVDSDLEVLSALGESLGSKIRSNETFRITVEKRHSTLNRREVIGAVAEKIDREVDLESPAKTIQLEILGHMIGVSVLGPSDIFSLEAERRIKRISENSIGGED
jgi:tRNA acetyltransferase TAN1